MQLKRLPALLALALTLLLHGALGAQTTIASLPTRLSDAEFWKFVQDMSEPNGQFASNNFVSNETMFQYVVPELVAKTKPGNVYLGVGPEQNFTYIAALKPSMAIIFDIRRGNLHLQMMYKALFELSATRAEFVSRLFSKPMPPMATTVTADSIFSSIWLVPTDSLLFRKNLREMMDLLLKKHSFGLTETDTAGIRFVYEAFYYGGPGMDYGNSNVTRGYYPNYAVLMTETDGTAQKSFLATEANWRFLKDLHSRNMLVPVVGDFGGPKAIRGVGAWLKERGAKVQAFYTSNVEQYLFQSTNSWRNYYANVATLPLDASSTYIRGDASGPNPAQIMYRANISCSIQRHLELVAQGAVRNYEEAIARCREIR